MPFSSVKIDFMAKKYDLFVKKTKKMNFLIFWLKIGRIRYLRRPISQNLKKKPKNLTSPVNIKCFNLKNHQQLKKKIYPQKNGVRFTLGRVLQDPPPVLKGLSGRGNSLDDATPNFISDSNS